MYFRDQGVDDTSNVRPFGQRHEPLGLRHCLHGARYRLRGQRNTHTSTRYELVILSPSMNLPVRGANL